MAKPANEGQLRNGLYALRCHPRDVGKSFVGLHKIGTCLARCCKPCLLDGSDELHDVVMRTWRQPRGRFIGGMRQCFSQRIDARQRRINAPGSRQRVLIRDVLRQIGALDILHGAIGHLGDDKGRIFFDKLYLRLALSKGLS